MTSFRCGNYGNQRESKLKCRIQGRSLPVKFKYLPFLVSSRSDIPSSCAEQTHQWPCMAVEDCNSERAKYTIAEVGLTRSLVEGAKVWCYWRVLWLYGDMFPVQQSLEWYSALLSPARRQRLGIEKAKVKWVEMNLAKVPCVVGVLMKHLVLECFYFVFVIFLVG